MIKDENMSKWNKR